jgi:peptide-methionine (S)-S-oxide reductase
MALRKRYAMVAVLAWLSAAAHAQAFTDIPAFAADQPVSAAATQSIVLAGGCFWGVQGVFQHVKGVTSAVSGYAGGTPETASYHLVAGGKTAHAESVRVTYDPAQISLARLLQIYFSVAHDPTQVNRQGPDRGKQYRSAIFPANEEQAAIAKAYISQLNRARVYKAAIATKIESGRAFYPAEPTHQDFMTRYPALPYIVDHDLPKLEALQKMYPALYAAEPVLVNAKSE